VAGAVSATLGLSVLVLGIVRTDVTGWGAASTLALMATGLVLLAVFLAIEGRFASAPLMPLRIYASRTLSAANVVVLMIGAAVFAMWFFLSLYLQQVLGYSPLKAGLAFLPMTLCIIAGSTFASRAVTRSGLVNASRFVGGALGLAVLAALATAQTNSDSLHGAASHAALTSGFVLAFGIAAAFSAAGAVIALVGLPRVSLRGVRRRAIAAESA
jgi:hypothetical protein